MNDLVDVLKKRTVPGVMIFSRDNVLLYSNKEAKDIFPGLGQAIEGRDKCLDVIYKLCDEVKNNSKENCPHLVIFNNGRGPCSVRAFLADDAEGDKDHIMVLIERVIGQHGIDFYEVGKRFDLTNREVEVLKLISEGLSNRNISERLFICEYTVKDHIKKLMKKLGAPSRAVIMKKLNSLI